MILLIITIWFGSGVIACDYGIRKLGGKELLDRIPVMQNFYLFWIYIIFGILGPYTVYVTLKDVYARWHNRMMHRRTRRKLKEIVNSQKMKDIVEKTGGESSQLKELINKINNDKFEI